MEFLAEYGLFLAKSVTLLLAMLFAIGAVVSLGHKTKKHHEGEIEIASINHRLDKMRETIEHAVHSKEWLKARHKDEKKKLKEEKKKHQQDDPQEVTSPRVYVLDFDGDIRASAVSNLRQEITAVLEMATDKDEIVVKLESPGGMVHSYGLAASQLSRIKEKSIPLTVCVDKVAASGGYMMACIANKIMAAPFAIIGSIGVVAQLPNFHKLLKKHDIDYEVLTAGEYKRTLTLFGENSDKGRQKFMEDLEETHRLFKEWVGEHRDQIDVEEVAKGEVWYGKRAIDHNLIDELKTSDDYLVQRCGEADVYSVKYHEKKNLAEKLGISIATLFESLSLKLSRLLMAQKSL